MELIKYVHKNTSVSSVITTGAILTVGVIAAMNFDKIELAFREYTAKFEKKAVPSMQVIPPTRAENLGNIDEVYEAEQTNQTTNITDNYNIPAGKNVINVGNVKKVYKEKVEGGTTNYDRNFNIDK